MEDFVTQKKPVSSRNRKKSLENLSVQVAEQYYTAQEAQKRLGMTKDMFNHHVKQGAIKKTTFVGAHGYYLKAEIDALAEKIEYTLLTAEIPSLEYRSATFSDLDTLNRMAYLNFGELSRSPERVAARRRFLEANPDSTYVLLNYNTVVASLDIVPLKHEAVLEFREGKRGWHFPNEMIEQFEPGHRLECIIIDMMATTNAPLTKREYYASTLLRRFGTQTLVEWGKRAIDIATVDACGGFEQGKRILSNAGFISLGVKNGVREIYHLDIDQSDLIPLKPYKEALLQALNK
jgi:hypothetical protein